VVSNSPHSGDGSTWRPEPGNYGWRPRTADARWADVSSPSIRFVVQDAVLEARTRTVTQKVLQLQHKSGASPGRERETPRPSTLPAVTQKRGVSLAFRGDAPPFEPRRQGGDLRSR
jgi:hypothetical protein